MGKIVYLMGKSSTGKDTIFKALCQQNQEQLKTIIPYTTRPIRDGEQDGVEYYFTDEDGFQKLKQQGKIVEDRGYHTYYGLWRYFTVDDGQIDLQKHNYIMIGTLESYRQMCQYYGKDAFVPVLIQVDDGIRLQRALDRERQQENPRYEEMCRRFLADSEDFAADKIEQAGITGNFVNDKLEECLKEIQTYIETETGI